MKLHTDILTSAQEDVINLTALHIEDLGFYLAGGTALALHLGHRRSVDFDWFLPNEMGSPERIQQIFHDNDIQFETTSVDRGTLHGTIQGIRFSFLEYRYPLLKSRIEWPGRGITIADKKDLACMKLSAIAQRGSRKDFVDVYALLKEGFQLEELLEDYKEKYQQNSVGPVLYGLSYFDEAEDEPMPVMLWDISWSEIKTSIQKKVKHITQQ